MGGSEVLPLNISVFIMDACGVLILVNFDKESWVQRFLPLNISAVFFSSVAFHYGCM